MGLGACLADDMGLGKTLQVLALLQLLKAKDASFGTSLLIVPSTLIDNWLSEARKFTPKLSVCVAHTAYIGKEGLQKLETGGTNDYDLVVTTYAMARRLEWMSECNWYYLILDEAQAIKNPGAAQTKAIKRIAAHHRLVLTGTPIENRLGDLWSLFDFANRGLLGTAKAFKRFATSLNNRPEGYARLRKTISPYIIRRLKTDKSIIADLPEKIEMKAWAMLSKKQVVLYEDLVGSFSAMLASADGIKRKGLILAYLTKFKQVCNHPDHFAGTGAFRAADSGKLQKLGEICTEILEKRERVLVFTQFREMVEPLDRFLSQAFGRKGVCLHGGTRIAQRREAVGAFQNDKRYVPYFVLSVKAGGVGLNLTAANHVVHFDRWWNPAVERQAEDRAFRIGQKRTVVVHRFVSKGTIEEKIDKMIEEKKELSEKVLVGGNESWITELSDEKIRDMFKFGLQEK
jgi:non-specific serine/threonine protein kinase